MTGPIGSGDAYNPDVNVIVGVTGASGSIYARRLLVALDSSEAIDGVDLVVSSAARKTLRHELDVPSDGTLDLTLLLGRAPRKVRLHPIDAIDARIASGSNRSHGMVVIPCSVGTVARIANGVSDSLLARAADVCLKERRPLILVVRETPLSTIHLRNLTRAAEAGARIVPAMPAFYGRPKTIDDLVDQFTARVMDHLDLEHRLGERWRGGASEA